MRYGPKTERSERDATARSPTINQCEVCTNVGPVQTLLPKFPSMKMRKLLHIAAIMMSSLLSMLTHGKAAESQETAAAKEKKGDGAVARHHRHHSGASSVASQNDPPARARLGQSFASEDIKNSSHAATYSYAGQQSQGEVSAAPKLDPALMASAEQSVAPMLPSTTTPAPLAGDEDSRYPWKREIVTTTFWIGEAPTHNNPVPNRSSCWDPNWAKNYGGSDSPDTAQRKSDFTPASFTPAQNPFYVALPYNDMEHGAHKAEAAAKIPWFAKEYKGPTKSVCQGRWIEIRFGSKVCYAQWEDAGPFRTDHVDYVFGNDRPRWNLNRGAGLDVSPAVRDYLGMNGTDITDWKFVDFDEIPTGPWARFGENNTFVQNARNPGSQVAENFADHRASPLNGMIPGMSTPASEVR